MGDGLGIARAVTAITLRAMKANLTATLVLMVACEVAACGSGPNKDAMTMEQCRERLAMPKDRRPRSDDPRIDKDAICENMLSSEPPAKQVAPRTSFEALNLSP